MNIYKKIAGWAALLGLSFALAAPAFATGVVLSANTVVSLSSPSITFTIQSGSSITSFQVESGDLKATIPASSTFTLTSGSRDVTVAGASVLANVADACSSGTATITITTGASIENLTFTPDSSQCGAIAINGGGGGGGGGGSSSNSTIAITSFASNYSVVTAGQSATLSWDTINSSSVLISPGIGFVATSGTHAVSPLQTTVYTLTATGSGGTATKSLTILVGSSTATSTAPSTVTPPTPSPSASPVTGSLTMPGNNSRTAAGLSASSPSGMLSLTSLLKVGQTSGAGIMDLQKFLNSMGFTVAKSGVGSPGHETKTFGSLTSKALIKYQKSVKLKVTGKLDKVTLTYLKSQGY